jgi:voltage-gated potassium channel
MAFTAICTIIVCGSVGIHYFEGLNWLESVYFTTSTVTTVGYGDYVPHTRGGRIYTTFLILVGVGTVLYALSLLAQAFIQTEMLAALGTRRRTKEMEKLKDHYIICGAGRVGRRVIKTLQKEGIKYVVIELDQKKVEQIENWDRQLVLIGDATLESNLIKAGVERATGLATCLADDAANVYVVLTARDLNKKLHIVSRAVEEQAEPKLIRAGANRVVAPTIIGSQSMARALTKPAIADFMDSIVAENLDLVFEEVPILDNTQYIGRSLKDTNISRELNLLIVAIRRKEGEMLFHPSAETKIEQGDLLIVIGKADSMQQLVNLNPPAERV